MDALRRSLAVANREIQRLKNALAVAETFGRIGNGGGSGSTAGSGQVPGGRRSMDMTTRPPLWALGGSDTASVGGGSIDDFILDGSASGGADSVRAGVDAACVRAAAHTLRIGVDAACVRAVTDTPRVGVAAACVRAATDTLRAQDDERM